MRVPSLLALLAALSLGLPAVAEPAGRSSAACKPKGKEPAPAKKKKPKGDEPDEVAPAEKEPAPAAPAAPDPKAGDEEGRSLQRGERVEFDARLIQGQTAKAGAVYLFARVPTNLKSMVRERTSFREKIIRTVFPTEETTP